MRNVVTPLMLTSLVAAFCTPEEAEAEICPPGGMENGGTACLYPAELAAMNVDLEEQGSQYYAMYGTLFGIGYFVEYLWGRYYHHLNLYNDGLTIFGYESAASGCLENLVFCMSHPNAWPQLVADTYDRSSFYALQLWAFGIEVD